jgi:hypothetical protein
MNERVMSEREVTVVERPVGRQADCCPCAVEGVKRVTSNWWCQRRCGCSWCPCQVLTQWCVCNCSAGPARRRAVPPGHGVPPLLIIRGLLKCKAKFCWQVLFNPCCFGINKQTKHGSLILHTGRVPRVQPHRHQLGHVAVPQNVVRDSDAVPHQRHHAGQHGHHGGALGSHRARPGGGDGHRSHLADAELPQVRAGALRAYEGHRGLLRLTLCFNGAQCA